MSLFDAAQSSKSAEKQDLFIYEAFHKKWEGKRGFFVDVGAKDGIDVSNTYLFEQYFGWDGICFEPNPFSFLQCKQNRKGPVYPIALSIEKGVRDFFCSPTPGLSGLVDFYHPEHGSFAEYLEHRSPENVIRIETAPLQFFLDAHGVAHINFLDVDTEGGELEILQGIDYQKTKIDVINVENVFDKEKIRDFLKEKGFGLVHCFTYDDLFARDALL